MTVTDRLASRCLDGIIIKLMLVRCVCCLACMWLSIDPMEFLLLQHHISKSNRTCLLCKHQFCVCACHVLTVRPVNLFCSIPCCSAWWQHVLNCMHLRFYLIDLYWLAVNWTGSSRDRDRSGLPKLYFSIRVLAWLDMEPEKILVCLSHPPCITPACPIETC
jgi:hypothetical protein